MKDFNVADSMTEALNHFGYLIISYDKRELKIGEIIPNVTGFDEPCHIIAVASREEVKEYQNFYMQRGADPAKFRSGKFSYKVGFD